MQRVADVLESSLAGYGHHHLMGNISGNQDRARFITYASGDLRFDEDAKLAGWSREFGKPKASAYKKLALLHAFNFAIPGIPVIYYGDEYGMPGAGDPDNRRQMKFADYDADETALLADVKLLTHLRNNSLALIYGSTKVTVFNDDVLIIHRQYFGEHVWMIINKGNSLAEIPVEFFKHKEDGVIEEGPAGGISMTTTLGEGIGNIAVEPNDFGTLISKN